MDKLSKSKFRGKLNEACHLFTKGKRTEDVEKCIWLLTYKIEELKLILKKRDEK
jgi:hypothetical protein